MFELGKQRSSGPLRGRVPAHLSQRFAAIESIAVRPVPEPWKELTVTQARKSLEIMSV